VDSAYHRHALHDSHNSNRQKCLPRTPHVIPLPFFSTIKLSFFTLKSVCSLIRQVFVLHQYLFPFRTKNILFFVTSSSSTTSTIHSSSTPHNKNQINSIDSSKTPCFVQFEPSYAKCSSAINTCFHFTPKTSSSSSRHPLQHLDRWIHPPFFNIKIN
jgi:hypothetical protein